VFGLAGAAGWPVVQDKKPEKRLFGGGKKVIMRDCTAPGVG